MFDEAFDNIIVFNLLKDKPTPDFILLFMSRGTQWSQKGIFYPHGMQRV